MVYIVRSYVRRTPTTGTSFTCGHTHTYNRLFHVNPCVIRSSRERIRLQTVSAPADKVHTYNLPPFTQHTINIDAHDSVFECVCVCVCVSLWSIYQVSLITSCAFWCNTSHTHIQPNSHAGENKTKTQSGAICRISIHKHFHDVDT